MATENHEFHFSFFHVPITFSKMLSETISPPEQFPLTSIAKIGAEKSAALPVLKNKTAKSKRYTFVLVGMKNHFQLWASLDLSSFCFSCCSF